MEADAVITMQTKAKIKGDDTEAIMVAKNGAIEHAISMCVRLLHGLSASSGFCLLFCCWLRLFVDKWEFRLCFSLCHQSIFELIGKMKTYHLYDTNIL